MAKKLDEIEQSLKNYKKTGNAVKDIETAKQFLQDTYSGQPSDVVNPVIDHYVITHFGLIPKDDARTLKQFWSRIIKEAEKAAKELKKAQELEIKTSEKEAVRKAKEEAKKPIEIPASTVTSNIVRPPSHDEQQDNWYPFEIDNISFLAQINYHDLFISISNIEKPNDVVTISQRGISRINDITELTDLPAQIKNYLLSKFWKTQEEAKEITEMFLSQAKEELPSFNIENNNVAINLEYGGLKIGLVTKYTDGWKTSLEINGNPSQSIIHNEPLTKTERKRDTDLKKGISALTGVSLDVSKKIYDELLNGAHRATNDIIDLEKIRTERDTLIEKHRQSKLYEEEQVRRAKFNTQKEELLKILCNEAGTNTTEEDIQNAKTQLRELQMGSFSHTTEYGVVHLVKTEIADYLQQSYNLVRFGSHIWRFDWSRSFYTYDNDDVLLKQDVAEIINTVGFNGELAGQTKDIIQHASLKRVFVNNPFNKHKNYINVRNGVLELNYETREVNLIGKKPEFMFNYCIDTVYDPKADSSKIDQFVEQILGKDQKELFYQIPAIAIRDLDIDLEPSKICYAFIGPKHTGKDSLLNLLRKLFGDPMVTSIKLNDIAGNQFMLAQLEGKLLNMNGELPKKLENFSTEMIKELTGSKKHTVNPKGKTIYDTVITAIHIFAGNQYPKCSIKEDEEAYWDRWEILHTRNQFAINESYNSGIFTEQNMSALLNIVIKTMFDIHYNGVKKQTKDAYSEWMYSSNSVFKFLRDITIDTEEPANYPKEDLFTYYQLYCNDIGNIPNDEQYHTLAEFGNELINACKAKAKRGRKGEERLNQYTIYKKIKPEIVDLLLKLIESKQNSPEYLLIDSKLKDRLKPEKAQSPETLIDDW